MDLNEKWLKEKMEDNFKHYEIIYLEMKILVRELRLSLTFMFQAGKVKT